MLYSIPFPCKEVPDRVTILRSMLAPKVKDQGDGFFQFVAWHCLDGSRQVKGTDYEHTFSPTANPATVKLILALASSWHLLLGLLNVSNCFQSVQHDRIEDRRVASCPPFFMEWFKMKYPKVPVKQSPSNHYVCQILNGMQGDCEIGRKWYLLLKKNLEEFGFNQCPFDLSLYYFCDKAHVMLLNTSTNDFLCAYSDSTIFLHLQTHMKIYVGVTSQDGLVLNYLNLQILQSSHGISVDQSKHIQSTILDPWFGSAPQQLTCPVHTPYCTDSEYEKELYDVLPASEDELKQLNKEFGGSFPHHNGKFMHIMVLTCPDIAYAVTKLARSTPIVSSPVMECLARVACYLLAHPHRPIIFPHLSLKKSHLFRNEYDNEKFHQIEVTNGLATFADSEFARDTCNRRSMDSILIFLVYSLITKLATKVALLFIPLTQKFK